MEFHPLRRIDYELISSWFEDDTTKDFLEGFYPVEQQLTLIETTPTKHAWLAWKENTPVGLIELEMEGDVAHPLILVAPTARGRGYGHKLVTQIITLASHFEAKEIHAGVATNNYASWKCFEKAGFQLRKEEEGYYEYVLTLPIDQNTTTCVPYPSSTPPVTSSTSSSDPWPP